MKYAPTITTLLEALRHAGGVSDMAYRGAAGAASGGVRVAFGARLESDRLADLRFSAYGCPHTIAVAEWWCRRVTGLPVSALPMWDNRRIADELGVPEGKLMRLLVIEDAWSALMHEWRSARGTE